MAGRTRKAGASAPVVPTPALVASAVRYSGKVGRVFDQPKEWQKEAYRHYAICGEARFAANFFGHSLSKATLHVADEIQGVLKEVEATTRGAVVLKELFNGRDGQEAMLTAIGIHLTIAGECYLIGRSADPSRDLDHGMTEGQDLWEIVSRQEIRISGDEWTLVMGDGKPPVPLDDDDVVIRIWRPLPERRIEADSPFRSLLPVLREIEIITQHIYAQTQSRLLSAGILFMPQGMSFPPPPEQDGRPQQVANDADAFMRVLADVMVQARQTDGSPASVVPIVVTAPDDAIDKARLMTFWSQLDSAAQEMRGAAIRRFALGMDLPPEQILGMSSNSGSGGGTSNGISHWGAWQVEEATIKMHIEPMLELVCNALTIGYLRPITGSTERVRYDSSALRLRPDRSGEALELYDRGLISEAVLLRENGFDISDLPNDEERKMWLLRKVAGGSSTPEQVHAALKVLGVDLGPLTDPDAQPRQERPTPSLEDHERRAEPALAADIVPAAEALIYRALERAGNRLRSLAGNVTVRCPSYETHTVLSANGSSRDVMADAFPTAHLVFPEQHKWLVPALSGYCVDLLQTQTPHSRERLTEWLEASA